MAETRKESFPCFQTMSSPESRRMLRVQGLEPDEFGLPFISERPLEEG